MYINDGFGALEKIAPWGQRYAIITDSNVAQLYGSQIHHYLNSKGLSGDLFSFPAGEVNKTRETKQHLEDQLHTNGYGRDTVIIALGGGVVTDMAGFVAATFCRGIPWVALPTTLMGMVDASMGGKVGVNTPAGKNLIGAFHLPQAIFINTQTLNTLPLNEIRYGMAEVVKYGLIASAELFFKVQNNLRRWHRSDFLQEIIPTCAAIKNAIVAQDPLDKGLRQILNFGHTIGHALEAASNYTLPHGEAVAAGMVWEAHYSHKMGYLTFREVEQIESVLEGLGFQNITFDEEKLLPFLKQDKKAKLQKPHYVTLEKIGKAKG